LERRSPRQRTDPLETGTDSGVVGTRGDKARRWRLNQMKYTQVGNTIGDT